MKNISVIILAATLLAVACKEKPAAPAAQTAATAPVIDEKKVQSGIYMGPGKGSCLCVNAEKGIAGTSGTLSAMSTNLGNRYEEASEDMKAALKEKFAGLKFVSKEQVVDSDGGAKYTRVPKASDCELLNTSAAAPVGYQDYCIEGNVQAKPKEL